MDLDDFVGKPLDQDAPASYFSRLVPHITDMVKLGKRRTLHYPLKEKYDWKFSQLEEQVVQLVDKVKKKNTRTTRIL